MGITQLAQLHTRIRFSGWLQRSCDYKNWGKATGGTRVLVAAGSLIHWMPQPGAGSGLSRPCGPGPHWAHSGPVLRGLGLRARGSRLAIGEPCEPLAGGSFRSVAVAFAGTLTSPPPWDEACPQASAPGKRACTLSSQVSSNADGSDHHIRTCSTRVPIFRRQRRCRTATGTTGMLVGWGRTSEVGVPGLRQRRSWET